MKIILYLFITFCIIIAFAILGFLSYEKGRINGGKATEINSFNYYYTLIKNYPKNKKNIPLYHYFKSRYYSSAYYIDDCEIENTMEDFGKISNNFYIPSYHCKDRTPEYDYSKFKKRCIKL